MTTHAMPATPLAASLPSISPRPAVALDGGDVFVTVTFRPCSPIGSTEVTASPDSLDATGLLTLLDATMARLTVYRDAFHQAMSEDADPAPARAPLPLPTPWYAW
jgi:hypothetical protein